MEGKFKQKSPVEYLSFVAQKNIDLCYNYFIAKDIPKELAGKVCLPKDSNDGSCSNGEKLLFVLSCIDLSFGSGVFKKTEIDWDGPKVAKNAPSPLPSMFLSGMYCISQH